MSDVEHYRKWREDRAAHVKAEFAAVHTPDDFVLCVEFDDGTIEVRHERHRLNNSSVKIINHTYYGGHRKEEHTSFYEGPVMPV